MIRDVYVFLKPENMAAEEPKNYHVIEAQFDDQNNKLMYNHGSSAICECCSVAPSACIDLAQLKEHSDNAMRTFLAQQQNLGKQVCANCVKHFYADE